MGTRTAPAAVPGIWHTGGACEPRRVGAVPRGPVGNRPRSSWGSQASRPAGPATPAAPAPPPLSSDYPPLVQQAAAPGASRGGGGGNAGGPPLGGAWGPKGEDVRKKAPAVPVQAPAPPPGRLYTTCREAAGAAAASIAAAEELIDREVERLLPRRDKLRRSVEDALGNSPEAQGLLAGCRLEVVGSTAWGGAVPQSDLDLVLLTPKWGLEVHEAVELLAELRRRLDAQENSSWKKVELLDSPRVPILRLFDGALSCDVSVDQRRSLDHRSMLQEALSGRPEVLSLIRLVKFWLRRRGLPMAAEGGLPSLAWAVTALRLAEDYPPGTSVAELLVYFFSKLQHLGEWSLGVRQVPAGTRFVWKPRLLPAAWQAEWVQLLWVDDPTHPPPSDLGLDNSQPPSVAHGLTPPSIPAALGALYVAELRLAWKAIRESSWDEIWRSATPEARMTLPSAIDLKKEKAPLHILLKDGLVVFGQLQEVKRCPGVQCELLHRRDQSSELLLQPCGLQREGSSEAMTILKCKGSKAITCQPCHWVCALPTWGNARVMPGDGLSRLTEVTALMDSVANAHCIPGLRRGWYVALPRSLPTGAMPVHAAAAVALPLWPAVWPGCPEPPGPLPPGSAALHAAAAGHMAMQQKRRQLPDRERERPPSVQQCARRSLEVLPPGPRPPSAPTHGAAAAVGATLAAPGVFEPGKPLGRQVKGCVGKPNGKALAREAWAGAAGVGKAGAAEAPGAGVGAPAPRGGHAEKAISDESTRASDSDDDSQGATGARRRGNALVPVEPGPVLRGSAAASAYASPAPWARPTAPGVWATLPAGPGRPQAASPPAAAPAAGGGSARAAAMAGAGEAAAAPPAALDGKPGRSETAQPGGSGARPGGGSCMGTKVETPRAGSADAEAGAADGKKEAGGGEGCQEQGEEDEVEEEQGGEGEGEEQEAGQHEEEQEEDKTKEQGAEEEHEEEEEEEEEADCEEEPSRPALGYEVDKVDEEDVSEEEYQEANEGEEEEESEEEEASEAGVGGAYAVEGSALHRGPGEAEEEDEEEEDADGGAGEEAAAAGPRAGETSCSRGEDAAARAALEQGLASTPGLPSREASPAPGVGVARHRMPSDRRLRSCVGQSPRWATLLALNLDAPQWCQAKHHAQAPRGASAAGAATQEAS